MTWPSFLLYGDSDIVWFFCNCLVLVLSGFSVDVCKLEEGKSWTLSNAHGVNSTSFLILFPILCKSYGGILLIITSIFGLWKCAQHMYWCTGWKWFTWNKDHPVDNTHRKDWKLWLCSCPRLSQSVIVPWEALNTQLQNCAKPLTW